jgi:hypothetical protein
MRSDEEPGWPRAGSTAGISPATNNGLSVAQSTSQVQLSSVISAVTVNSTPPGADVCAFERAGGVSPGDFAEAGSLLFADKLGVDAFAWRSVTVSRRRARRFLRPRSHGAIAGFHRRSYSSIHLACRAHTQYLSISFCSSPFAWAFLATPFSRGDTRPNNPVILASAM